VKNNTLLPAFTTTMELTAHSNHPSESGQLKLALTVDQHHLTKGTIIHRLAAKAKIQELQLLMITKQQNNDQNSQKILEQQIQKLAIQHQITSKYTSFIITYQKNDKQQQQQQEDTEAEIGPENIEHLRSSLMVQMARQCMLVPGRGSIKKRALSSQARTARMETDTASLDECDNSLGALLAPMPKQSMTSKSSTMTSKIKSLFKGQRNNPDKIAILPNINHQVPTRSTNQMETEDCAESGQVDSRGSTHRQISSPALSAAAAFQELIRLCSSSGVWPLNQELIRISQSISSSSTITLQQCQLLAKQSGINGVYRNEAIAVLIALLLLSGYYSARNQEWELLAAKARYWLENTAKVGKMKEQELEDNIHKMGL